jgi:tetratricopeptide (TPR) repeat protein
LKFAVTGVSLLFIAVGILTWFQRAGSSERAGDSDSGQGGELEQQRLKALLREGQPPASPSSEEETRALIAEYERRLEEEPQSPEVPAVLSALGNLYSQKLLDCRRASEYYEEIILNYPSWEGARVIYPQLAVCYERMGETEQLQWLYRRMMEVFPPDTQEHAFARAQLNL